MQIPRVCLSAASPGPRRSCACFVLAVAGVMLTACGSSPTAPSVGFPDVAPPATASASAASLTIKITDGTLAIATGMLGSVMLKGSHGFRFDGRVYSSGLLPSSFCGSDAPCQPGATVPFLAAWVGTDIPGTARVQGDEFIIQGQDGTSMYIMLQGSFVAPAHVTDSTSVTVPFTATGLLSRGYPLPQLELKGDGNVTLTLTWQPFIGGWGITYSSFDFGSGGPD
jgi:hypothetical protein